MRNPRNDSLTGLTAQFVWTSRYELSSEKVAISPRTGGAACTKIGTKTKRPMAIFGNILRPHGGRY